VANKRYRQRKRARQAGLSGEVTSQNKRRRRLYTIAGVLFLLVAAWQLRTFTWRETEGQVVESGRLTLRTPSTDDGKPTRRLAITHRYEFEGVIYVATQTRAAHSRQRQNELRRRYSSGHKITVLHSRRNPAMSTLSHLKFPVRGRVKPTE